MTVTIPKNFRQLAVLFLLFVGMFGGYLEKPSILRYALVVFLVFLCITNPYVKRNLRNNINGLFLLLFLLAAVIVVNVLIHDNSGALGNNLLALLYGFCVLLMVLLLSTCDSYGIFNTLDRYLFFINLFGVINLVVVTIQIFFVHGFLMRPEWLLRNSFYEDLCCGLFGYNATHEMTYFFCFWMLLNLYEAFCNAQPKRKRKLLVFVVCMSAWMIVISTQNDNVAFLGIYAMFLVLYILYYVGNRYKLSAKAVMKYLRYFLLLVAVVALLFIVPQTREFIVDDLIYRLNLILAPDVANANGSNERLAIVIYALQQGYGLTGIGLGAHGWVASADVGFLGFNHFGLNSISSFITLGGVPFYVLYVLLYSWLLWRMDTHNRNWLWFMAIILIVAVSSLYTVIFTSYISAIWMALSVVVFIMTKHKLKGDL